MRLFWRRPCGYDSAHSWVLAALGEQRNSLGKWMLSPLTGLDCPSFLVSDRAAVAVEAAVGPPPEKDAGRTLAAAVPAADSAQLDAWGTASKKARGEPTDDDATGWLVVKALEAFRGGAKCPKGTALAEIRISEKLGEGVYGEVRLGVLLATGQRVAVKALKDTSKINFLQEVAFLSRLTHPNVVRLVDVTAQPNMQLIFAYAGPDLQHLLDKGRFDRANWQLAGTQVLAGLAYLHGRLVVHGDLKPGNLAWNQDASVVTILDFGCSLVSLPGYRSCWPVEDVGRDGLEYVSLGYRAIELALGDPCWGQPSDCWSAGVVFTALWGVPGFFRETTAERMVLKIFRKLGSPSGAQLDYFQKLPRFSPQMPVMAAPALASLFPEAPASFLETVQGLLQLCPSDRWTAARAHDFLQSSPWREALTRDLATPETCRGSLSAAAAVPAAVSLGLVKVADQSRFKGSRGEFNLRHGFVDAALLQWLRDGLEGISEWSFAEVAAAKDRFVEMKQKLEICGHLGQSAKRKGLTLNGKDASRPLALRLRAFSLAFKDANKESIAEVDAALKTVISPLSAAKRGRNGNAFLKGDAAKWSFDLGALQVMKSNSRCDPVHYDGGASFLHGGLTLFGERALICRYAEDGLEESPEKELEVLMKPGHFYMGCLCGPEHYVRHRPSRSLLRTESCGDVEVVLLMRSLVFRAARASTQQSGPAPKALWEAVCPAMAECLARTVWVLPPLAACESIAATL